MVTVRCWEIATFLCITTRNPSSVLLLQTDESGPFKGRKDSEMQTA
jgi:hypothetical protein